MKLRSIICLISLVAICFLNVTIQYSCTDPIEDQLEKKDKQEEKQDSTIHQQDSVTHQQDSIPEQQDSVPEQHDIYKNIATFLEYSLEGELSDFTEIVKKSGLWDAMSESDIYTCFAPTNDALRYYLQDKAMNQSIQALPDSLCNIIAKRHLIRSAIYLRNLQEDNGILPVPNLLNEYLNYAILRDTMYMGEGEYLLLTKYLINDHSIVIMVDDTVGNGVVHVLDHVIGSTR